MRSLFLVLLFCLLPAAEDTIAIATFNVQVFGKAKMSNQDIVDQLVDVVRAYDLIAIQEIKDISGETPIKFLNAINAVDGPKYHVCISQRTGLQDNDKNSQEQYAFYYNIETIEKIGVDILFDDSKDDLFQREPFMAQFKAKKGNFDFVAITIHTKPDMAVYEIKNLHNVVDWARNKYSNEQDFIVLGDFNADGRYATPEDLDKLEIRNPKEYIWIIPDNADTNTSINTSEAYDRIVITNRCVSDYNNEWGVDTFFDKKMSDHFPVYAKFLINNDDDIDYRSLIKQLKDLRKLDKKLYDEILKESEKD